MLIANRQGKPSVVIMISEEGMLSYVVCNRIYFVIG